MPARLITQVADNQLQIALVGQPSPLVEEIAHYCQRQSFAVTRFDLTEAATLTDHAPVSDWYKVILVVEVTATLVEADFHTALSHWQSALPKQRVGLVTFPTLIDSAMPEYRHWLAESKLALKVLKLVKAAAPVLFLGQDVVVGEAWTPLAAMKKTGLGVELLNPELTLYPQPYLDFWQRCKQDLFNPQPSTWLYRGEPRTAEVILHEYLRQVRALTPGVVPTISSLPATQVTLPLVPDQKLTVDSAALPDIIQPSVRAAKPSVPKKAGLPAPSLNRPQKTITDRSPSRSKAPTAAKVATTVGNQQPPTQPAAALPNQELVEKVQAVFSEQRSQEKRASVKAIAQAQTQATGRKKHRQWLFATAIGFMSLGSGLVAAMAFYFLSTLVLRQSFWAALSVFEQENPAAVPLQRAFAQQSGLLTVQTSLYSNFMPPVLLGSAPTWAELSQKMIVVHRDFDTFAQQLGEQVVIAVNPSTLLDPASLKIAERSQTVTTLAALLDQLEPETFSADRQQLLKNYKSWLKAHSSELVAYQRLQPVLSQIVGSERPRKYAVVFQNDQELRPTGGFIQSLGVLTFANGQLIDSQTYSVYSLDNQLKAQVTPPTEVTQLLGEKAWFLRDSNWNPDFPKAATNLQWFIEHETNQEIEGVITLTGPALASILEAVGPVDLPEYNEVITHRNLAERLEFHSEVQLTNQADSKEYTELLLQRIIQKIQTITPEKGRSLVVALQEQLHQKNMLLYFEDSGEQSTIQALGWSGKLLLPDCPSQLAAAGNCLVDTLAVVDANIGVNKANYHLKRTETHTIALSETKATHTHTLTFDNTSRSNAWPQGTYHAYTRFYLPQAAQIQEVKLNDQVISPEQLFKTNYDIFNVMGVVSQTPIQQQTTLTFTYSTPLSQPTKWSYAFFYQKQAGVPLALSAVEMRHSSTLTPKIIAPQAEVQLGTINFTNLEDDHVFVGVSF